MELWITEQQNENVNFSCRVKRTIYSEKTDFQEIEILETEYFGKMMILDGVIQTTTFDEALHGKYTDLSQRIALLYDRIKKYDPSRPSAARVPDFETRCYSPEVHVAGFILPKYVKELVE